MKTSVAQTSIENYYNTDSINTFASIRRRIVSSLEKNTTYTRREIADLVGIDYSCASGRVNELIAQGELVEVGTAPRGHRGRLVGVVRLPMLAESGA